MVQERRGTLYAGSPEALKSTLLRAPARQGSQSKGLCFTASFHVPPSCTQPRFMNLVKVMNCSDGVLHLVISVNPVPYLFTEHPQGAGQY